MKRNAFATAALWLGIVLNLAAIRLILTETGKHPRSELLLQLTALCYGSSIGIRK
jgi:hypothetical protein